jgi:hypothetical protein
MPMKSASVAHLGHWSERRSHVPVDLKVVGLCAHSQATAGPAVLQAAKGLRKVYVKWVVWDMGVYADCGEEVRRFDTRNGYRFDKGRGLCSPAHSLSRGRHYVGAPFLAYAVGPKLAGLRDDDQYNVRAGVFNEELPIMQENGAEASLHNNAAKQVTAASDDFEMGRVENATRKIKRAFKFAIECKDKLV